MRTRSALVAAVVACSLASCGGSDSEDTTTAAGGGGASAADADALREAQAGLDELISDPPKIDVPSVDEPIPAGKTITYAGCPLPVCVLVGKGVEAAADSLGWKVKNVNLGLTPQSVQSAWNGIVQNPGDGVVSVGVLPNSAVKAQLQRLDGLPHVASTQIDPPDDLMQARVAPPAQIEADGEAMADWIVVQGRGKPGETLYVYDPALTPIIGAHDQFHKRMGELCPDCKVTDLKVSSADAGTKIPNRVVNALRRAPDTKYVAFNLGDIAAGVPAAVKAANLADPPTLIARAASTTNMADVKNGTMAAAITSEVPEAGWRAVDLIARLMVGQDLYDDEPSGERALLTKDDLPADITVPYVVPDYERAFEQAWGK
jgi:ribose transport system substrate-binding protein